MAEGPVALPSVDPGGDSGSPDRWRGSRGFWTHSIQGVDNTKVWTASKPSNGELAIPSISIRRKSCVGSRLNRKARKSCVGSRLNRKKLAVHV
jgi:hypothetical protein